MPSGGLHQTKWAVKGAKDESETKTKRSAECEKSMWSASYDDIFYQTGMEPLPKTLLLMEVLQVNKHLIFVNC